ncbi:helix-turn-helix domain-containing protein [Conexibacter sp. CPCC 206217]|uniref:helix-turn-helix domain-containing protein n=1 Tax=Conexibacter sp. CPCC 206217 TaxID=3064574 RepID=UPI002722B881|nr:helix-turn-helix transcriptional regulator [Conexibacter sp. CPCC 206217]MDO8213520.1 helix-turn-helix transcriptional regulator [Conexibacter sp. CPCC 206217]
MESGSANRIGEYLRARRELVRPEDVGLPDLGRRRVPGLRREELALLAGISSDYYVRLEQGRDQHPSAQVLDALARALQLDDDATVYLHGLAHPPRRRRPAPRRPERVRPGLVQLIEGWHETPAIVQGRLGEVLASNALARALSPIYEPGVNALRAVFLDPAVRDLYGDDWERVAESVVAGARALAGPEVDDPQLAELVGELSIRSDHFRRLWARHDVRPRTGGGVRRLQHPQVGALELHYEKLAVTGSDGQTIVVYHADPGSASAQGLALLASIAAGEPATARGGSTPGAG